MALSPLGPFNPLLKLFGKEQRDGGEKTETKTAQTTDTQDVIDISEAARERLDGIRSFSADKPEEIGETAQETKSILEETGLSLGLDETFA